MVWGGLNIDACRVGNECIIQRQKDMSVYKNNNFTAGKNARMTGITTETNGRFPANTILTYDDTDFEEVCGGMPNTKSSGAVVVHKDFKKHNGSMMHFSSLEADAGIYNNGYVSPSDSGSAARYFYCAKASKRDRDEGLDHFKDKALAFSNQAQAEVKRGNKLKKGGMNDVRIRKNIHPTVKPTDLMQYLVRLVTPNGGTVLDPFNGSGSTGKAVMYENKDRNKGYKYIGIELNEEYLEISKARIEYVCGVEEPEIEEDHQISIFEMLGET